MFRLLHVADLHLGASFSAFGGLAEERKQQQLAAFRRLPEFAAEHDAQAVLVCGDLFDGPEPTRKISDAASETLARLGGDGRHVFIIPGNYDAVTLDPNPYQDSIGEAVIITDPVFGPPASVETKEGPLHVYGIAFDRNREGKPLSTFKRTNEPGIHVVLLHAAVREGRQADASPSELCLRPKDLEALDAGYIALGGDHCFKSPLNFNPGNRLAACYAGSFAALHPGETGKRGFVAVELEEGKPPQLTLHSSGLREIEELGELDVERCANEREVAEAISKRLSEEAFPSVRLIGTPSFPLDPEIVLGQARERFGHAAIADETTYFLSTKLEELTRKDTLAGHIARIGRRRIEEARTQDERLVADRALRIALKELGV